MARLNIVLVFIPAEEGEDVNFTDCMRAIRSPELTFVPTSRTNCDEKKCCPHRESLWRRGLTAFFQDCLTSLEGIRRWHRYFACVEAGDVFVGRREQSREGNIGKVFFVKTKILCHICRRSVFIHFCAHCLCYCLCSILFPQNPRRSNKWINCIQ